MVTTGATVAGSNLALDLSLFQNILESVNSFFFFFFEKEPHS